LVRGPALPRAGVASTATRQLIDISRAERTLRYVHAYPSIENSPSNAICRGLGFELVSEYEFEYPKARLMRCNDCRFDLFT
jgi:RimJ/RimL family protein N-acetyltransferase